VYSASLEQAALRPTEIFKKENQIKSRLENIQQESVWTIASNSFRIKTK
jgi:hypothetical protein